MPADVEKAANVVDESDVDEIVDIEHRRAHRATTVPWPPQPNSAKAARAEWSRRSHPSPIAKGRPQSIHYAPRHHIHALDNISSPLADQVSSNTHSQSDCGVNRRDGYGVPVARGYPVAPPASGEVRVSHP